MPRYFSSCTCVLHFWIFHSSLTRLRFSSWENLFMPCNRWRGLLLQLQNHLFLPPTLLDFASCACSLLPCLRSSRVKVAVSSWGKNAMHKAPCSLCNSVLWVRSIWSDRCQPHAPFGFSGCQHGTHALPSAWHACASVSMARMRFPRRWTPRCVPSRVNRDFVFN